MCNLICFFLLLPLMYYVPLHPVHVSYSNIEYNANTRKLDIIIKLYTDDFEQIVNRKNNIILNLAKENELKNASIYCIRYVYDHFKIKINRNTHWEKTAIFQGKKHTELETFLYFSVSLKKQAKSIELTNTLMNDLYQDQNNLVIFNFSDNEIALKMDAKTYYKKLL